ncbi:CheR family methyltransferase [Pontibacter sp. MBLB2868]|uniref:CheR family methyltransferase n=1 Tax=Pontibacter sp. MBLB2868 TaxID=3451555 RepID=UPI003F754EB0
MAKSTKREIVKDAGSEAKEIADQEVFVIGIGASAGGLMALQALFSSVPQDSVAYVIVQHISSEHRSMLKEILAQYSKLEVMEAGDNMPVELNKVYVIPNNKELIIKDNHLQLLDKTSVGRSKTVDTFFNSLAADKKNRSVGIILSGTGNDGTEGVTAIKEAGGLVLVQDPSTAKFDSMPRNAISTGKADFVIAPELMPNEIFNFVKVAPITQNVTELVNSETESSFFLILEMVHERTGIDFNNYKRPTIIRRISRRMAAKEIKNLVDYHDYLNLHPEEVETLSKEFLIGVTKFFRDPEAFHLLATKVIPDLVDKKKVSEQLRVWVAGCSTGEEAYSIAILIREYLDKVKKELEVKIFASDIDREALDFAGKGLYEAGCLTGVPQEYIKDYFVKKDDKFLVSPRVRRQVIFAPHNIINDPPFSSIDLVSCRNMLIYLNPVLQKRVINKFHYSLLIGGYLFLGSSESIGDQKGLTEVSKKWKIYRNTDPVNPQGVADTFVNTPLSKRSKTPMPSYKRELSTRQLLHQNFNELLNETILEEYGYAAVYIDENNEVLHGAGKYKNYLDLPENNFTFNLLKLVPQDLAVTLGTLLRKALLHNEKVSANNVQVRDGKTLRHINILIKPLSSDTKHYQQYMLVLFSEEQPRIPLKTNHIPKDNFYEKRVKELEQELQYTKEDLQTVVEELETSNEELQSTNEELLSSNEELQSTNEELQSLNEELHTINAEHQYKIKALVELDNDLNNYFRSTEIGQIFVDRKLIIRKYTPAATNLINLIESDIGRTIDHISNNLRYDYLVEDVRFVIASNKVLEKVVQDKKGVWYQMRVLPYITQEQKIDGAIIIFIEINELKNLHLLHTGILESSPNAILAVKAVRNRSNVITDFMLKIANNNAQKLFGQAEGSMIGKTLWNAYPDLPDHNLFEQFVHVVETGEQLVTELWQTHNRKKRWIHIVAVKFDDGLVITQQDITDRKLYDKALKQQQQAIKASEERFRTLIEAIPHITWTNKPNGESNTFNKLWYDYTGLTEKESKGWGWEKAFHPDDLKIIIPTYHAALESGEVHTAQARIYCKEEQEYRMHLIKDVPIRNEEGEIVLWIGTATDIQDQKDAEEANIRLHLSQQRTILYAILQAQEEERSRISEALHNGLGQVLYAAKLNLDNLCPNNSNRNKVKDNIDQLLTQGIKITRDISFELTPSVLKEFGIRTAVEEIISRFSNMNLAITSEITGFDDGEVDYTTSLSLYRIIQELLNNIVKHSHATKATVKLNLKKNSILLLVQDNGIGINKDELNLIKGRGLSSIQNRIKLLEGKMEINCSEGNGCIFRITCQV